jgi:hypothetical protein
VHPTFQALDPHRFGNSFAEWHAMAIQALANLNCSGAHATPVHVLAEELLAWCRANRRQNAAASPAAWVAFRARLLQKPGVKPWTAPAQACATQRLGASFDRLNGGSDDDYEQAVRNKCA